MIKLGGAAFALCFLIGSGFAHAEGTASPKAQRPWSSKMRDLESALTQMMIDVSNDERFNDKKNFKSIQANADRFAKLAQSIKSKDDAPPDQDLSLQLIGSDFAEEAKIGAKTLSSGYRAYARVILGSMSSYCIACHTRNSVGPQFISQKVPKPLEALSPFSKGNYLLAIRSFDGALAEYSKILDEGQNAVTQPFEYERALKAGLSVAIRVKHDPDLALKLVAQVSKNPKTPYYLQSEVTDWKKSIDAWKAEKPFTSVEPKALFDEATRLVAQAKGVQKFPADRSADILYLRASAVIHDLLGRSPQGSMASNALFLAGLTYDVLSDYGIRDFNEFYYRSCIRQSPHSEIAQQCYRRYQESVYFGYTGSGGTYIPSDIRARLSELEALSIVQPVLPSEKPRMQ